MPVSKKRSFSVSASFKQRQKLLTDLDQVYALALEAQNYTIALKTLELRSRELGFFSDNKKDTSLPSLKEMTTEQLKQLLLI